MCLRDFFQPLFISIPHFRFAHYGKAVHAFYQHAPERASERARYFDLHLSDFISLAFTERQRPIIY
jgi:hypothetical protein